LPEAHTPTAEAGGDEDLLQAGVKKALEEFVPQEVRPEGVIEGLLRYVAMLLETNKRVNLVSRRDTERHVLRFVRESLFLTGALAKDAERLTPLERPLRLLDIGSGGGFPGMIVKIVLPGVETVLLDATRKKAGFLADVGKALDLKDLTVLWARTEDLLSEKNKAFRPEFKHGFDWVTTKAVGSLEHSTRLALSFLCVGGAHWTFKGADIQDELRSCQRLFKQTRMQRLLSREIPGETSSWILGLRRLPPAVSSS